MSIWFIALLFLPGALAVAFNIALFVFPRSRIMQAITRPVRARFMMRWSTGMDYRQARAIARMMDIRERRDRR